ncbi:MAG: HPr-rel-A system PqqD family protein [Bacteroidetes bacterium HGW-Bacteroidetes-11]|nr:MAG: HPr-rel-A system PqqD family protein [Bacteroidetes bacterium HGW-Bacteroidetes-11]
MIMKINHNLAVSESGFLFNPGTGESFTVNPIGAEIIAMLRNGKSRTEIIDSITQLYQVDRNSFEKDLQDFNGILKTYNLLEKDE